MEEVLRRRILKRDGHRCRSCGQESKLHVHHILTKEDKRNFEQRDGTVFPDELFNNDINLITLCESCHSFTFSNDSGRYLRRYYLPGEVEELKETRLKQQDLNRSYEDLKKQYKDDWNSPEYQDKKRKIDKERKELKKRENSILKSAGERGNNKRQEVFRICEDHWMGMHKEYS
ncbi:HNH endonuclease [Chloroflexota bacterium]